MVRGLIRGPDTSSDSFLVEIDGNQAAGAVNLWDVTPVGTAYAWDFLNNRNVADPVVLDLSVGSHVVTVFAREDGARLDRIELVSVNPLPMLTTSKSVVLGDFVVNVVFSTAVTGLTSGDFLINGGSLVSLGGSGTSYNLTISPTSGIVSVALSAGAAVDANGNANLGSNVLNVTWRNRYQQWASDQGVAIAEGSQLADDDGDGIAALLEYAFNLNPAKPDSLRYDPATSPLAGLPRMLITQGNPSGRQLSLQYLRRKGVAGLAYDAQFGAGLDGFSHATGTPVIESINADWERVTIADPAGAGGASRFGRVVVTWTP